jgi:hypothetical protein
MDLTPTGCDMFRYRFTNFKTCYSFSLFHKSYPGKYHYKLYKRGEKWLTHVHRLRRKRWELAELRELSTWSVLAVNKSKANESHLASSARLTRLQKIFATRRRDEEAQLVKVSTYRFCMALSSLQEVQSVPIIKLQNGFLVLPILDVSRRESDTTELPSAPFPKTLR